MKQTDNQHANPTVEETQQAEINNVEGFEDDKMADQETPATDNMSDATDASAELSAMQDKYLRLQAEFDNFRKRTIKEKLELIETGGERVVVALLTVVDDLERALGAMTEGAEKEGVTLIYKKFLDTLKANKVEPIEALDKPLDVDFHDAVANFHTEDRAKVGLVIDVVQTGYTMGEKVIRHAKVVVGE